MLPFIFVVLVVGGGLAALVYYRYRTLLREAKNYERGLKMVSLVIHLPPPSDDIEMGTRDSRDVTEETISKAQVLYNIIASTATKGFKSKFYGQRHISFEIVAAKGLVHYYAAVPVAMVSVVRQAVVSAYPSATLEEVEEHNIFSPVGKISGTIGGELVLKENSAHPIATYSDTKRDAMQSILNAFSTLTHEDGAAIQMLLRPAKEGWTKKAQSLASDKREGNDKGGSGIGGWLRQVLEALWKAPEKSDEARQTPEKKALSPLEQSNIDAIEEKTRHPGYETLIRLVSSSNTSTRSQAVLNNMVASFALFDAPGKNGFKFVPAKDIERFVTSYIFRFFPPEVNATILNSVELATIFHLPEQRDTPTSQITRQASKQVDGPNNIAQEGLLLGYNVFRGVIKNIMLNHEDRRRHLYTVGQTGTGKSVFLENMAYQDMQEGRGFAFIDPHGDAVEKLISMVPKERTEDVIYFSPADMDYPLGLNLFEFQTPQQKDFLIQEAINMLYKLYDPQHTGIIGPRYEHWFRNAALTLMSDPAGSTFIEIPKIFTDNQFAKAKQKHVTDPTVLDFWNKEMAKTTDYHKSEILGWFVSKFGAFMSNEMMRNIIGQPKSSFDLRDVMDNKKILLVNLSKGRVGELNSKLLGMIFIMKFQAAAMSRADIPEDQRNDFSLYVDEFQNFSTDSFATILSEARKYRLNLIVANQFISQLTDEVRDAVFGNVGSVVSLRTGANDADFLIKQFAPVFGSEDLVKLPNYNAVVQLMVGGVPSQPFSMKTVEPLGNPKPQLGIALKKLSAAKYGRPRAAVEKEIFERLQTKATPLASKPGAPGAAAARARRPAGPGGAKSSGKSFLDEWLEKRKTQRKAAPAAPKPASAAAVVAPTPPSPLPAPIAPLPSPVPPPAPHPVAPPSVASVQPPPAPHPVAPPPAPHPVAPPPAPPAPHLAPVVPPAPPANPATEPLSFTPSTNTPQLNADTSNIFTPTPGSVVGADNANPSRHQVLKDPEPEQENEDEIATGAPTNFASQMDLLKAKMKEQKSSLAGSRTDKDDVANIANVVKQNIKWQPDSEEESPPPPAPDGDIDMSSIEDSNEIYIDKDGKVHYGNEEAEEPEDKGQDEDSATPLAEPAADSSEVSVEEPEEPTKPEPKEESKPESKPKPQPQSESKKAYAPITPPPIPGHTPKPKDSQKTETKDPSKQTQSGSKPQPSSGQSSSKKNRNRNRRRSSSKSGSKPNSNQQKPNPSKSESK